MGQKQIFRLPFPDLSKNLVDTILFVTMKLKTWNQLICMLGPFPLTHCQWFLLSGSNIDLVIHPVSDDGNVFFHFDGTSDFAKDNRIEIICLLCAGTVPFFHKFKSISSNVTLREHVVISAIILQMVGQNLLSCGHDH